MLEAQGSNDAVNHTKPSKRWVIPTAILIVFVIILSIIYWPKTEEERLPTLQEIQDAGLDPLGLGFPTEYPQFEPGDTVEIRDQIIDIWYTDTPASQAPSSYMVTFPYKDGVWPILNNISITMAIVFDDIGPYALGDWIQLVGIVVNGTSFHGAYFEMIYWNVKGGPGTITPPTISMVNTTSPCSNHAIEISEINRANNIIHYQFRLFKGELAIGDLDLKAGPLGLYLRFEDRGRIGFLDAGDRIHITDLAPGSYSLFTKYAGVEINNFSFVIDS